MGILGAQISLATRTPPDHFSLDSGLAVFKGYKLAPDCFFLLI